MNYEETLERIDQIIDIKEPIQHCVINTNKVYLMSKSKQLSDVIKKCPFLQADGMSVVWATWLLYKKRIPRITGIDLMIRLLEHSSKKEYAIYFLGATPNTLTRMLNEVRVHYPGVRIFGSHHGYFTELESDKIIDEIRSLAPDILFVGMSSPKKEFWLAENLGKLNVPFCMGVGGSFDVLAGITMRAPQWVQNIGMEWAFRMIQEPIRLGSRYLVSNSYFAWNVLLEWFRLHIPKSLIR